MKWLINLFKKRKAKNNESDFIGLNRTSYLGYGRPTNPDRDYRSSSPIRVQSNPPSQTGIDSRYDSDWYDIRRDEFNMFSAPYDFGSSSSDSSSPSSDYGSSDSSNDSFDFGGGDGGGAGASGDY